MVHIIITGAGSDEHRVFEIAPFQPWEILWESMITVIKKLEYVQVQLVDDPSSYVQGVVNMVVSLSTTPGRMAYKRT